MASTPETTLPAADAAQNPVPEPDLQARVRELELENARNAAALEEARKYAQQAVTRPEPTNQTAQLPQDWDLMDRADQVAWEIEQREKARQAQEAQQRQADAARWSQVHAANLKRDVLQGLDPESQRFAQAEIDNILKANPAALSQGYTPDWVEKIQTLAEGAAVRHARATKPKEPAAAPPSSDAGLEDYIRRQCAMVKGFELTPEKLERMKQDPQIVRDYKMEAGR